MNIANVEEASKELVGILQDSEIINAESNLFNLLRQNNTNQDDILTAYDLLRTKLDSRFTKENASIDLLGLLKNHVNGKALLNLRTQILEQLKDKSDLRKYAPFHEQNRNELTNLLNWATQSISLLKSIDTTKKSLIEDEHAILRLIFKAGINIRTLSELNVNSKRWQELFEQIIEAFKLEQEPVSILSVNEGSFILDLQVYSQVAFWIMGIVVGASQLILNLTSIRKNLSDMAASSAESQIVSMDDVIKLAETKIDSAVQDFIKKELSEAMQKNGWDDKNNKNIKKNLKDSIIMIVNFVSSGGEVNLLADRSSDKEKSTTAKKLASSAKENYKKINSSDAPKLLVQPKDIDV